MDQYFGTMLLPDAPDAIAPDGSQVRVLLRLDGGSMAHFRLAAGQVSRAVAHHAVDELWYVLSGHGQMWRRQGTGKRPCRCGPAPACPSRRARTSSSAPTMAGR